MNKSKEEIEFRILESKGKALLDREIMETFLSAVHERPQAQEIAKNLVNTYTGVGRILGREMDDLKVIEGVTDSAVAMIMCVKETLERVLREKLKSEPIKVLVDAHANLDARGDYGKAPLDIARDSSIAEYLEKKLNEKGEKPVQRRRRHHHGDHNRNHNHSSHKFLSVDSSNQPGIAASSSTRPSSWINDLFSWVKSSVGGFRAVLPEETLSTTSSISQVDAPIDVNGTIMLLDFP